MLERYGYSDISKTLLREKQRQISHVENKAKRESVLKSYYALVEEYKNLDRNNYKNIDSMYPSAVALEKKYKEVEPEATCETDKKYKNITIIVKNLQACKKKILTLIDDLKQSVAEANTIEVLSEVKGRIDDFFREYTIQPNEYHELKNIRISIVDFKKEIDRLKKVAGSSYSLNALEKDLRYKYKTAKVKFGAIAIIDLVIKAIHNEQAELEENWKKTHLELTDFSQDNILAWKKSIREIPDYLSTATCTKLEKLQNEVQRYLDMYDDIEKLKKTKGDRKQFESVVEELNVKYLRSGFSGASIFEAVSLSILNEMSALEREWIQDNLGFDNSDRDDILTWKSKIVSLPLYLSKQTIEQVNELRKVADSQLLYLDDIDLLNASITSRKDFHIVADELSLKYHNDSIQKAIQDAEETMKELEQKWIEENLTLGDGTEKAVLRWKDKILNTPDYLSEDTLSKIEEMKEEAEKILSDAKVEAVIYYFSSLSKEEKQKCFAMLMGKYMNF